MITVLVLYINTPVSICKGPFKKYFFWIEKHLYLIKDYRLIYHRFLIQ